MLAHNCVRCIKDLSPIVKHDIPVEDSSKTLSDAFSDPITNNRRRGYYVMTHISSPGIVPILRRCLHSIRQVDKHTPICVIDDNSPVQIDYSGELNFPDVTYVKNTIYPGSAEIYPYYHNYKFDLFDSFVTLHDTMVLKKAIPCNIWDDTCRFMWYFNSGICVESVENDLRHVCDNHLTHGNNIMKAYIHDANLNKKGLKENAWSGCFGVSMITQKEFINNLFDKYNLESIYPYITKRNRRCMCERLFGILKYLECPTECGSNSLNGNIFNHPHPLRRDKEHVSLGRLLRRSRIYNQYAVKTWQWR